MSAAADAAGGVDWQAYAEAFTRRYQREIAREVAAARLPTSRGYVVFAARVGSAPEPVFVLLTRAEAAAALAEAGLHFARAVVEELAEDSEPGTVPVLISVTLPGAQGRLLVARASVAGALSRAVG